LDWGGWQWFKLKNIELINISCFKLVYKFLAGALFSFQQNARNLQLAATCWLKDAAKEGWWVGPYNWN
jgi:hypothetical protein